MAVNIISARDGERNCAPGVLHSDTFDPLANGVIFQAEFCDFCLTRIYSPTNFRAKKARENLGRVLKKTEGHLKNVRVLKKVGCRLVSPWRGANVTDGHLIHVYIVIKCAAS